MIKRHLVSLFFEFQEGRSDKAAKLHSVTRSERQELAATKLINVDEIVASVSGGDYWAETGEAGRWVRVHTHPRTAPFAPWKVPGGPGWRTRLVPERSTRGVDSQGQQFRVDDLWDTPNRSMRPMTPWTGRTICLVDNVHSDRWETDQRRQRIEVANLNESQSEKDIDLFKEGAHSTKPRWSALSGIKIPNLTHTQIPLRSQQSSISEQLSRSYTTPCRRELRR